MKLKYYLRGLGIGIVMTALIMGVATKEKQIMTDDEIIERALQLGMVEQRTLADIKEEDKSDLLSESQGESKETVESVVNSENDVDSSLGFEVETQTQETGDVVLESDEFIAESSESEEIYSTEETLTDSETSSEAMKETLTDEEASPEPSEELVTESTDNTSEYESESANPTEESEESSEENEVVGEVVQIEIVHGDSSYSVSKRLEEAGLVNDASEYDGYLCKNGYDRKLNIGVYQITAGMTDEEIAKIITRTR